MRYRGLSFTFISPSNILIGPANPKKFLIKTSVSSAKKVNEDLFKEKFSINLSFKIGD